MLIRSNSRTMCDWMQSRVAMYRVLLDGHTKCGLFQGVCKPSRGVVGVDSEMYTKGMGIPGIDCGVSMSGWYYAGVLLRGNTSGRYYY